MSTTPEHAPQGTTTLRGSFTLPGRPNLRSASTPAARTTSDGIETLFICPTSKVVSFTTTSPTRRLSPTRTSRGQGSPARAAWTSLTERTLAAGMLRVYRVTASNVSFLSSGALLHTIFPRSQCWCVDNRSVFVLRVRQDSYYRIELPYETDEDKDRMTQFTSVLAQVLQYERTACPFRRDFEVETTERPKTPPRKQRKHQPTQRAKKWTFDKTWVPNSGARPTSSASDGAFGGLDCGTFSSYDDDDMSSVCTDSSEAVREVPQTVSDDATPKPARRLSIADRVNLFQGMRSATAPVVRDRNVSAVSVNRIPEAIPESPRVDDECQKPVLERQVSEADSIASSADSFYSVETTQYRSPSPHFLDAEPDMSNPWADLSLSERNETRGRSIHRRKISELTARGPSVEAVGGAEPVTPTTSYHPMIMRADDAQPSSAPSTPPLVSDSDDDSLELPGLDVATPPDAIRMKRLTGASQRRAFSPMPQPKNLFVPAAQPNIGRQFTAALVRKTCELVLGPPAHLVSMMLRIAASISNFGFQSYRLRREEKIPCAWESDDEAEWLEEDDFGIPLSNVATSPQQRRAYSSELD